MKPRNLIFRVDKILEEKGMTITQFAEASVPFGVYKFRVDEILDKKNISESEFSELVGIHRATAVAIVHNHYKRIGLKTLAQMCAALKVHVDELLVEEALTGGENKGLHYNTALAIVNNDYKRVGLDVLSRIKNGLQVELNDLFEWEK